ncbi:MAG: hypothetical protein NT062_11995 [Proteobacteria bacterium]|nr:hypothetical protein [Pseudomonadota bacterium]
MPLHRLTLFLVVIVVALATARTAAAYPQYQLARDVTCTGCHVSPDGGGLLNENGQTVAESTAWKDGDGSFMYGMSKPSWLALGGDVRGAAGFVYPGTPSAAAYPMQVEAAANATSHGFTLHVTGGFRSPQEGGSALHVLWSREHYAMWQSNPDEGKGVYVRAGRFTPTYGLRLAEHVVYTQKFGGRPLFDEAYAASVSYVDPRFEVHGTGFLHDPLAASVEKGDGGAGYAEVRLGSHAAIGAEGKYSRGDEQTKTFAGMTGKVYVESADLLFQAEAEVIRQHITIGAGFRATQLAGYLLATKPLSHGLLLDVGAGHYTEDTSVKGLYRDCLDVNLHWFVTPHLEGLLTTRVEVLDLGGSPSGGYALVQVHYRL